MCGLAGAGGPAEGSVLSGGWVWASAGASVNSASGRPSDNPSATRSHVLMGLLLAGEVTFVSNEGRCAPPVLDRIILRAQALRLRCEISPPTWPWVKTGKARTGQ